MTSEGNDGLKLWINHHRRHGCPPPIQLGIEQGDEVTIAGEVVFKGAAPIIEIAGGPAGEGRGHGERSEGHRRAGGGCQGRPTDRCAAQRSQRPPAGSLVSALTPGARAERSAAPPGVLGEAEKPTVRSASLPMGRDGQSPRPWRQGLSIPCIVISGGCRTVTTFRFDTEISADRVLHLPPGVPLGPVTITVTEQEEPCRRPCRPTWVVVRSCLTSSLPLSARVGGKGLRLYLDSCVLIHASWSNTLLISG